jgi:hypothetical protein
MLVSPRRPMPSWAAARTLCPSPQLRSPVGRPQQRLHASAPATGPLDPATARASGHALSAPAGPHRRQHPGRGPGATQPSPTAPTGNDREPLNREQKVRIHRARPPAQARHPTTGARTRTLRHYREHERQQADRVPSRVPTQLNHLRRHDHHPRIHRASARAPMAFRCTCGRRRPLRAIRQNPDLAMPAQPWEGLPRNVGKEANVVRPFGSAPQSLSGFG